MKKTYDVIVADPPWSFQTWSKKGLGRAASNHYKVMNLKDIMALDVAEIAHKNCVLFLWACWPMLLWAFEVMEAWGFEYKTVGFVWVKTNRKSPGLHTGLGYYTRANTEICLIATRGHPRRVAKRDVHQIISEAVQKHSQKPNEIFKRIERLYPKRRYLELFARRRYSNKWHIWGNQVKSDVTIRSNHASQKSKTNLHKKKVHPPNRKRRQTKSRR